MDADLSHDQKTYQDSKNLDRYDLVIGSRYVEGVSICQLANSKTYANYGANLYSRIITGMPINDGTGGFKAWKTSLLKKYLYQKSISRLFFPNRMNFRSWVWEL